MAGNMAKRIATCAACGIAAALILYGCAAGGADAKQKETVPEYVFTYAENQAEDYPTSEGARKFAQLVEERTGGRIQIVVKAGAQLGDEKAVLEQMQFGGIDFARVSLSPLAEIVPQMNILQMPYLYTGPEHMWRVLDGEIGDQFMGFFGDVKLEPLSWYDGGVRSLYTSTRPIRQLEDMKGMKIRVQQSVLMMDIVRALGADPVPTAFEDVYSGLQKGEIDGAENSWPSFESERHYEVAPYYTLDEHTRVPEMQLASQITWDKLSEEDQGLIRQCARESAIYQRSLWKEREKTSEQKVIRAGCERIELSAEEKEKFRQAVAGVYEKYCTNYMDIVRAIREEGEE